MCIVKSLVVQNSHLKPMNLSMFKIIIKSLSHCFIRLIGPSKKQKERPPTDDLFPGKEWQASYNGEKDLWGYCL